MLREAFGITLILSLEDFPDMASKEPPGRFLTSSFSNKSQIVLSQSNENITLCSYNISL